MQTKLLYLRDVIRTSFWFVPSLMVVAAIGLAFAMVAIDRALEEELKRAFDWSYTGGPDGARSVLSTIGGSMITVAGVVFSITIVALSLASSQFGPRLLRNFIRDRANQVVLGTFIATFVYCLLVLRTVRSSDHGNFVPSVSVFVGVLLGLTSLGVLIYFIHHVATAIQATQVITAVSEELHHSIDRLFPEELGQGVDEAEADFDEATLKDRGPSKPIAARHGGYLLAIERETLLQIAKKHDLLVYLHCRPGHFMIKNQQIAEVWPKSKATDDVCLQIASVFQSGPERTAFQDVEFGVDQLVEVAVRALSPGVNDPFTAMNCLDRLGEALCKLATRHIPSPLRLDSDGIPRVIAYPVSFANIADEAFNQIRQYGRSSPAVMIRMLEAIRNVAERARRRDDLESLTRHAEAVLAAARSAVPDDVDREDVHDRYVSVIEQIRKVRGLPTADAAAS